MSAPGALAATAAVLLISPAAAAPARAGGPKRAAGAFSATLRADNHRPRVGARWRYRVRVRDRRGRPIRATARVEFLFGGQVVGFDGTYRFRGNWTDVIVWPARAIGYPLTFRVALSTALVRRNLDWAVRVRR